MFVHLTKLEGKLGLFWVVGIRIVVLFIVTPYTLLREYQRFRDISCLHLQCYIFCE
jgi:hypothetical protein